MNVQYIKHSGFLVEFEKSIFIFDYYKGELLLPKTSKHIYFFVSHKHADHFSFKIFEYAKEHNSITFILSNDMKMNEKYMDRKEVPVEARDHIVYAHKNERFVLDQMVTVETLASTDEGVAYMIDYNENGKVTKLYHAGDLNWWTWIGETKEEYENMKRSFFNEMKKIEGRDFDCAFVPLDPRQGERFWWGMDAFMKSADAKIVFPMHCWEDYTVIPKLRKMEEAKEYCDKIMEVHHCFETFDNL